MICKLDEMNRIEKKFQELENKKKKAFIPYLMAGYPDLATTEFLIYALEKAGADIIELGVPFSDPVADGPVIQNAGNEALKKDVSLKKVLGLVKKVRKNSQIPLVLMSYFNPVLNYGKNFFEEAVTAGVDGLIIPDLPVEEGQRVIQPAVTAGLSLIFLSAPTTSLKRLKKIISLTRGYLYYVSLTGITGIRKNLAKGLISRLKKLRSVSTKPIVVGFGFSNTDQIKRIKPYVDGVIVGSAIIKFIQKNLDKPRKELIKRVYKFCKFLSGALQ